MIVGLLILLTGLLNFFHFLMGTFLNRNREYGIRKVMGSGNQRLFYQLFVQSVIIAFIAFLFTFCLIEIISPYLNFNLFNYVLIIEKNLLFIQTTEYMIFILFLCMILCFITVLRIHYTSIQTEIHGSEIKRHKHWNAKYTVRYPIFYMLDFRRIYRSSLYASGKNGIYPIQHID